MDDPLKDPLVIEVLDHEHASSRYQGCFTGADADGSAEHAACTDGGDRVRLTVRVNAGRVVDVAFEVEGCVVARGAAALLARGMLGTAVSAITEWADADVERLVGLPLAPARAACARLAVDALRDGLATGSARPAADAVTF